MEWFKVVKNPISGDILNVRVLGIPVYRKKYSDENSTRNHTIYIKQLLYNANLKYKHFKAKEDEVKHYSVICPVCKTEYEGDFFEEEVVRCSKCNEMFAVKDSVHKEVPKEVEEKPKDYFGWWEQFRNSPQGKKEEKQFKDWFDTKVPIEANFDAGNAEIEFKHRLRNNEKLGINFKEAVRVNKEEMDNELMSLRYID